MPTAPTTHPYDVAFAWSSLWVLFAAYHVDQTTPCPRFLQLFMIIQTGVSVDHWVQYREGWRKVLDITLSQLVFIWHLYLILGLGYPRDPRLKQQCAVCAALSAFLFYFNAIVLRCRARSMVRYTLRELWQLLPHSTFRFFAFWMVMMVHGQSWSWPLTGAYYASLLYLGWPREKRRWWVGGWWVRQ